MRRNYEKPVVEYIRFSYTDIVAATGGPETETETGLNPIIPPSMLFKSKNLDPGIEYYKRGGKLFTEDELSDFLDDETPF